MTGLVRKALLLTALGLMVAGSAFALVPNRANSSFPPNGITLVGFNAANTPREDVAGEFSVTVRDINNAVLSGATVDIAFGACTPDIRIANTQTFGTTTVDCVAKKVSQVTNVLGVATFRILGGASNAGNSAGAGFECGVISSEGVFFNNVTVAAFDQNAGSILNGAIANDISVVVSDVLGNSTAGRSDFNFNDAVQANDISFEVNDVLSNRSLSNVGAANACP
jgi:hypothetical protein